MITEPSPRMVLPENMPMWRSLVAIGFTTISSVWNTLSTTTPKVCAPTWVTTMKPLSGIALSPSSFSRLARRMSGKSLLRSRSTAASLMRSMRCSDLPCTRTSSTTESCGMAKRSPADSHDQRRDDGERQRNLDGEAQTFALHRMHVDAAADLIDVVAHHVHADAAAGYAGDLLRRSRSRA